MDIELKRSIELLITSCRQIDSSKHSGQGSIEAKVIDDFHSFIAAVSTANIEERIDLFDQEYLDADGTKASGGGASFPEALPVLSQLDSTVFRSKNLCLSELYISAFSELGKHYIFSKHDKKDIDAKRYASIIKSMQEYLPKQNIYENNLVRSELAEEKQRIENENGSSAASYESEPPEEPEESLEELMDQLNSLIGLEGVKHEVSSLINLLKIKKVREDRGFKVADVSKHLVFLGNPGTGKTTVARLLSKIYKQLGALEKGQLVEVDRAGLVAGYVGQTALKTKEKIEEAMGGILFIDEAYTLAKGGNDFGQEAIDTILKAMEDCRDSFVVIVAGYPEPMSSFLESNPGLKSRFNKNILFEDYSEAELLQIFHSFCDKYDIHMSPEAEDALVGYLNKLCKNKPVNFANGREMRNLFETAYSNQANRLSTLNEISDEALNEITIEDLTI